jgi:hypothetical protein
MKTLAALADKLRFVVSAEEARIYYEALQIPPNSLRDKDRI